MKAFLLLFGIYIIVVWTARRHAPRRHKIRSIAQERVMWETNTSMLHATAQLRFAPKKTHNIRRDVAHVPATTKIEIENISPFSLDLAKRFDIVVKTVFAVEWLQNGRVSDFTREMYSKHLEVWNNFKEPCTFTGEKDWFDASKPCIKKATAQNFTSSFEKTVQSLRDNGFDNSKSIVLVTKSLFPLNGAHRIAAAIALGMNTMPVQMTSSDHAFNWDANFFVNKGFDTKYADFAMLQFLMHINNRVESALSFLQYHHDNVHAVMLFPSVRNQKMDVVKTIIKEDAKIITERAFWLKKNPLTCLCSRYIPMKIGFRMGLGGKPNIVSRQTQKKSRFVFFSFQRHFP